MAQLKDTHVHGDLLVDGNITPWGGSTTGRAFIGYRMISYSHGSVALGQSVGSQTYDVNVVDGTDYWFPIFLGSSYGHPYSVSLTTELINQHQFIFNVANYSDGTHTLSTQWLIACFKNL